MKLATIASAILATALLYSGTAAAQGCPEKNISYWQAFPAGGESDISARHQQLVLKKRCPSIETIVQYKPGAGGGLILPACKINQFHDQGITDISVTSRIVKLISVTIFTETDKNNFNPIYGL